MNNPINTNSFRHFLEIRGVEYEICEPVNFIQANFKAVQDDIARDTFFGNEEVQLEFYKNYGQPTETYQNNDGVLVSHLPSGFDLLNEENNNLGNEADVKYILKKDGVSFTTGNFDFSENFITDGDSYIKCRVIQNNNQSLIKKREDIIIDLLANKDLDDKAISAIPVQKMYLKAKPTYQEATWTSPNVYDQNLNSLGDGNTTYYFYNNAQNISKAGIEDDLSFLEQTLKLPESIGDFDDLAASNFAYVRAKNDISNVKIRIKGLDLSQVCDVDNGGNGFVETSFKIRWGYDVNSPLGGYLPINYSIDENQTANNVIADQTFTIDYLPAGAFIWIYFKSKVRQSATNIGTVPRFEAFTRIEQYTIDIDLTATAISSVINAVRWIDLIKQNYKAIGSLPVDAPKYDVGGEFYDNFLFNKNLIRQDLSKPFYIKLKDTKEALLEQCAYAQINKDRIFAGQYPDFYKNVDMGGFLEDATYDSNFVKNEKYLVNKYVFGYEKYEQDRNERNTIDAIHTDSEWFPQTQNSINTKSFKLPFIRDPFITEVARKAVFSINENSTSDDDNIFNFDVVQLAPNSRNSFTRPLDYQTSQSLGQIKILSDRAFNWLLLGFKVGDVLVVNGVNRKVIDVTINIITLSYSGVDFVGSTVFTIDYPLTDVLYTNRTSEGLIFSNNLRNSDNFGNLRYSIKRNMRHWFSVLATYGKFIPTKKIKNTYFKANGECITQFQGEPLPIKENADINISDISEFKILSQDIYKTKIKCSFEKAVQLLEDIQEIRGFIRIQSPKGSIIKGYIKDLDYVWDSEEMTLTLEVKNESDFLRVDFINNQLVINEVGYSQKVANTKNFNIFNDFIQFFDENSINLCSRIKYDKVLVNGVSYNSIEELINAIEAL
jgi:hypothetical protein